MTNGNYDWNAFINLAILQQSNKREDQERLSHMLSSFSTENGWKMCASFLLRDESFNQLFKEDYDLGIKDYFCFRAIEEYILSVYKSNCNTDAVDSMHLFILKYIESFVYLKYGSCERYLRNKCIDIITKIGIIDYPCKWPSFFNDMIMLIRVSNESIFNKEHSIDKMNIYGENAFDFFLKFLIYWEGEIGAKEAQSQPFLERNTKIKDYMRENDLNSVMEIINFVIVNIGFRKPMLLKKALKVASLYAVWVDINYLITNDIIDGVIYSIVYCEQGNVKSAAIDYLIGIISKGMSDSHKIELISHIDNKLNQKSVWNKFIEEAKLIPNNNGQESSYDEDEIDNCFYVTLGTLNSVIGLQLIDAYKNLQKGCDKSNNNNMNNNPMSAIYVRIKGALEFSNCANMNIADTNLNLIQNYLSLMKCVYKCDMSTKKTRKMNGVVTTELKSNQCINMNTYEIELIKEILNMIYLKLQYPDWYNFDKEEDNEEEFLNLRKQLLIILTLAIQLNEDVVCKYIVDMIKYTVNQQTNLRSNQIESALTMFYQIGEAVKSVKSDYFRPECSIHHSMLEIMGLLCQSGIGCYDNTEVKIVFFEILFRFERYFMYHSERLLDIIALFLSEHGLRSCQLKVVTRCVYILSRFIKIHKNSLGNASMDILKEISSILQASFTNRIIFCTETSSTVTAYSYLYESASQLLLSLSVENKPQMFRNLIEPIILEVPRLSHEWAQSALLATPTDDINTNNSNTHNIKANKLAGSLCSATTYVNYTLRAFNGSVSLCQTNCLDVYISALDVFINNIYTAFNTCTQPMAVGRQKINGGLRSLLRILCKCAKSDDGAIESILSRLPKCIELFSANLSINELGFLPLCNEVSEIVPLYMQIINGFHLKSLEFLQSSLYPIFNISHNLIKASFTIDFTVNDNLSRVEVDDKIHELIRLNFQLLKSNLRLIIYSQTADNICNILATSIHIINQLLQHKFDHLAIRSCIAVFEEYLNLHKMDTIDKSIAERIVMECIYQQLLPLLFTIPISDYFNFNDANCHFVFDDIVNFQKHSNDILPSFQAQLIQRILPILNIDQHTKNEYINCINLRKEDLMQFLKKMYMEIRPR